MRRQLFLFLFLLFSRSVLSQNLFLDSLVLRLPHLKKIEKVQALNALSAGYYTINLEQAATYSEMALELATAIGDKVGQADALDNLGFVFQQKFDYTHAMKYFLDAKKIRDELGDMQGQAISLNNIGRIFYLQENFTQAEEYLIKSLYMWADLKDAKPSLIAKANKDVADVYLASKIYGKAKEHYRRSLEQLLEAKDVEGAARIASHLGNISSELSDHEGALVYYKTCLDLHRDINDSENVAFDLQNIATVLMAQGAAEDASKANQAALDLFKQVGNHYGMALCYKNFGRIYLALKDVAKAKDNLAHCSQLLSGLNSSQDAASLYAEVASIYAETGEFHKAFLAHLDYSLIRDSVFTQEKDKALLELTTRYDSEFKAKEREQKIALLEIANTNARKLRWFLLAVIGLIGILLTTVWISYRRKRRDNLLLSAKNAEIVQQKNIINLKNAELQEKNQNLDLLNQKLVSEIAERENVERSSFARDRFLAVMSHEMRTPLNVITGLTHILLESRPRTDQIEHLRTLQFSANDLVVFINDVLDFSKIEAGKLHLEDREFLPAKTFGDIRKRFERTAEDKGLLLSMNFDPQIPEKLMGDSARLNQILTNLLTNAFQHARDGLVTASIMIHKPGLKEVVLKIVVEDNNDNPDRTNLEDAFKPWNARAGEFDGYDGKYLSLAITKRLIELQNGKLEIVTKPGLGTAFIVYLPFKMVNVQPVKKEVKTAASFSHLAGSRILVVEDNKINQLVVAKMLRKLGIEVTTADNGVEALEIFEHEDFDLILMDIQMPEMDGYRTTAEIRRYTDPSKREIPIIALTASAFLTEKEKARLFGMNDHVGKPFSPEELLEKISTCLEIRKRA